MNKEAKESLAKFKNFRLFLMSHIRRCSVCNKKFLRYDRKVEAGIADSWEYVREHKVCFECGFWMQLIEHRPDGLQVINGVCYRILPFVDEPKFTMLLGSNGKKYYFVTTDRKPFKSNDVWRIGVVPQQFRNQLQDTGWFCDKSVYGRLLNFDKMCKEVGCLDRYKCFRFRTELEIKNGPYNEVPKKWVVGGERCRYFINTDKIKNYVSPLQINT